MPNPALERIAESRSCSVEEARAFCVQVQRLHKPCPSFKCIAQAVRQLEHQSYTEQDVAQLATKLHASQSQVRPRSKPSQSQVRARSKPSQLRVRVRSKSKPQPSQSRIERALEHIAELRGCSIKEAAAFCLQVRKLCGGLYPSFTCISQAVQQLEHQSYTLQDVAQLAKKLYAGEQPSFTRLQDQVRTKPTVTCMVAPPSPGFTRLQNRIRAELASPDFKEGTRGLVIHRQDLEQFLRRKWQEITSIERSFGLAQHQAHEVEVAVGLLNRLGVERLRFRQQGLTPPAVGVDFVMQHEVVWPCALDTTGGLQPHPQLDQLFPADYQLLLNLAAVVHYADLVVPKEPTRLQPAASSTEISRSPSSPEGTTEEPSQSVRTKRIPRLKPSTASHHGPRSRVTATKRPSRVDPFRRRLPAGQKPSFAKIVEADQAGISLQGPGYPEVQYTFVRAHIRGGGDAVPQYVYADYQAVKTFEHLLNVLGFP